MDLGTIYGAIDLNDGPFRGGLTRSLGLLNGWKGSALKIAGVVGATFGTLAVGAMVKNSISAFADFESNMNQIAASTDAPAAGLERLSDLALKLGKDTVFSAGEASGAMLELAKSGMTPAQIEAGALAASLKLAAAGGMGLEAAATTTANAINMFGLEAKDANAVANALAGGANASSASVESLAQGLSQVGPGARNAGMSLEETVAVLAAFDNAGIKGSDAGTSLKTMLTALTPSSAQAAAAMKEVGLMTEDGTNAFINADGTFKSMADVAGILQDKLGGLSEAQRTVALEAIFGSDASRAATALMNMGTEGIQKNLKATQDKTAADRMAEAQMKGLKGAFEQLGGSVETLGISLMIHLGPALTAAVNGVTGAFNVLIAAVDGIAAAWGPATAFLSEHDTAVKIIAGTITALLIPAMIGWGVHATTAAAANVAAWLSAKAGAISSVAWQLFAYTALGLGWIATAAAATAGAIATAAAWLIAIWPIALVVAAVALVVFLIIKYWDQIKAATSAAWAWVVAQVQKVPGLIVAFFMNWTLPGLIIKHWDTIKATFSAGVAAVVSFMKALPGKILSAVGNAGSWLLQVGKDIMGGLRDGIEAGFDWIRTKLQGVGRVIPGWLKSVLGIASPSKVMRDQVGVWIPAGVAEGIDAGIVDVESAARRMGLAAVIPITAAPSLRIPTEIEGAASSLAVTGTDGPGTGGYNGPLVEQHVHTQPGMSEKQVGDMAGNSLVHHLDSKGRPRR